MTRYATVWLRPDAGHRCRLDQRHDERDHQPRTFTTRPSWQSAPRTSKRSGRRSKKYTPEYVEKITGIPADGSDRRPPASTPRPSAPTILYCHGHHPAHHGHGQREVARQPGHALRQHGQAGQRGEPAARAEQRAGRLRHGRACRTVFPATRRWPKTPSASPSRMPGASKLPSKPGLTVTQMHRRPPTSGTHQGPVRHGREPA
ncbi:MAG: hypothetical protein MZW92_05980 [Comamonadaceae bacterium]|nr:hypothetical protein [Comamonadaceae bacterium]